MNNDIRNLDTTKQYIGLSFSNRLLSEFIERTQEGGEDIKGEKSSHVLAVAYDIDNWYVWEAVLPYIRKLPLSQFIQEQLTARSKSTFLFKEFPLSVLALNYYYDFKKYYPYDIKNLVFRLMDNFPILRGKDTKNLICSKYLAICQPDFGVCYKYNIPYDQITPAHCQSYVKHKPIVYSLNLK